MVIWNKILKFKKNSQNRYELTRKYPNIYESELLISNKDIHKYNTRIKMISMPHTYQTYDTWMKEIRL